MKPQTLPGGQTEILRRELRDQAPRARWLRPLLEGCFDEDLTSTVADIEHVATRKPGLTEEFALTLKVMEQRREAIVAGMARSKASKGAPEQATKAPDAAPTAPATPVNS